MIRLFTICLLLLPLIVKAQSTDIVAAEKTGYFPVFVTVFNNGTFLPGGGAMGIFSKTLHPGISAGARFYYLEKRKSELFQTARLGYFYHRFSQHAIQLYTELGYRYRFTEALYAEILPAVGYLHAIPDVQQFKFENGIYKTRAGIGRPQFMGGVGLSLGYNFYKTSTFPIGLFLQYQFWLQMPFVNKYVPMLPNSSLHLGINFRIKKSNKSS